MSFQIGSLVVISESGDEYGTGFYLIPGGEEEVINQIKEKSGSAITRKYKDISAPYVVDYNANSFIRIEELLFK